MKIKNKVKILIYTPLFYPSVGGLEILIEQLANNFFKKGNEVILITKVQKSIEKKFNFKVFYSPSIFKLVKLYLWADVFFMPNISLKCCWLFFINPFKKWVISHNSRYYDPEIKNYLQSTIKQLFLLKAKNISVSKDIAKSLWVKSTVIYNCYNDSIFYNQNLNREFTFLFVGRLVSSKGCIELINSFKKLLFIDKTITLAIVGTGPEEVLILNEINKLELNNSISFFGKLSQDEVAKIMNKSKCLVVPSIGSEAFGIVVLEGFACGCNVVTSDSTGLREANAGFGSIYSINSKNGLDDALFEYLHSNLCSDNNLSKLNNYLSLHTVDKVAESYLKIIYFE
ncbi:MAG: glycosyltransferase family 4 protein [Bacteroidota bacterium]